MSIAEIKSNYEVLALYGTNGLTAEIKSCLSGLPELEEIILFFDGDEAGIKAVEKNTIKRAIAKCKNKCSETKQVDNNELH